MPTSSLTSAEALTGNAKDCSPYWNDFTKELSSALWLPTATASRGSASNSSNGLHTKTEELSWFSITRTQAPSPNLPRIFSPSSIPSLADSTDSAATVKQSSKTRLYPGRKQRQTIKLWLDAARWCYNKTIETLREPGTTASWKKIKTSIINATPLRLQPAPYQVKSIAVRDACKAVSNAKKYNASLKQDQAQGLRTDQEFAIPGFRSRRNPRQNCFIPAKAVFQNGVYPRLLGNLKMAEQPPGNHGDSRLTLHNGQYHLSASIQYNPDLEQQASREWDRVVALDPGIRTFITWFSETDAGHIAQGAFGRIQRLCQHLDNLISKTAKAPRTKRRNMQKAADRMRNRIRNLIDELHHQTARFLVDDFDLILLPTFETQDMSKKGGRKLRSKSVRSLLTFAHYRFQRFLLWKAYQTGAKVLLTNEAYTSKTCSWSGEIVNKLGGARYITGQDGVTVERDINGARGVFLRALVDTPALADCVGCLANNVVNVR